MFAFVVIKYPHLDHFTFILVLNYNPRLYFVCDMSLRTKTTGGDNNCYHQRWTCSPMVWCCMSCCLGGGQHWGITSFRQLRSSPKASGHCSAVQKRFSSAASIACWLSAGTPSLRRWACLFMLKWVSWKCLQNIKKKHFEVIHPPPQRPRVVT